MLSKLIRMHISRHSRTIKSRNTVTEKTCEINSHDSLFQSCIRNCHHVCTSSFLEFSNKSVSDELSHDMLVYKDFISEEEENSLIGEIEPYIRRLRYERDHWDDAIHGYRETERRNWNENNSEILQRVRNFAFPPTVPKLAYIHILDLQKSGVIKPHIDAVRFCGNTIAGLSLLSSAVMRLTHDKDEEKTACIFLEQRSLYIMRDIARYQYKHEVLSEKESKFKGKIIPRDRRISLIMRNEPNKEIESELT